MTNFNSINGSQVPIFDEKLNQFIKDVYETDLLKPDYLDELEKRGVANNPAAAISNADRIVKINPNLLCATRTFL
jgi:hypothetical protein